MASVLKVNTLTGVTTAGSIAVTGEGKSTTTNLQQGLAKVWGNYNASQALQDSFNTASITDVATGDHTINFSNNMGNANYAMGSTGSNGSGAAATSYTMTAGDLATDRVQVDVFLPTASGMAKGDRSTNLYMITGDLA